MDGAIIVCAATDGPMPQTLSLIHISHSLSLLKKVQAKELFLLRNGTEIEGFHRAMKRDGVAMVKFLRWLKAAVSTGNETEDVYKRQVILY